MPPTCFKPDESLARLVRCGQMLDAADNRQLQISPEKYRILALETIQLLGDLMGSPSAKLACEMSPSLTELFANAMFPFDLAPNVTKVDFNRFKASLQ